MRSGFIKTVSNKTYKGVLFTKQALKGTHYIGCSFSDCTFEGCDLSGCVFYKSCSIFRVFFKNCQVSRMVIGKLVTADLIYFSECSGQLLNLIGLRTTCLSMHTCSFPKLLYINTQVNTLIVYNTSLAGATIHKVKVRDFRGNNVDISNAIITKEAKKNIGSGFIRNLDNFIISPFIKVYKKVGGGVPKPARPMPAHVVPNRSAVLTCSDTNELRKAINEYFRAI